MAETKVSMKTPSIVEGSKQISNGLKTMRESIDNMPECSIKKSLMLTQETYEKKINSIVKREQIASAMAAIRKNPEKFLNALPDDVKAEFASSDENASEVVKNAPTSGKRKH